jgi:dUTP pyrophosphatase
MLTLENVIDQKLNDVPTYYFALRPDLAGDSRFIPTKATPKATGWDVRSAISGKLTLRAGQYAKIPLGIRGFCPDGWWYKLVPRSSTFGKKNLHCLYGTIDEDYEGELLFACQYMPDLSSLAHDVVIEFGDAIGQIIPEKRVVAKMEELSNEELDALFAERNSDRGAGGFGSTGK